MSQLATALGHSFTSPLRYPGGKGALANFMKLVIRENDLMDGHYAEPYAGGAGVAWPLLFEEYVHCVHINDLNKSVQAFWGAVVDHTEELCKLIRDVPVTMEQWNRQRVVQQHPESFSSLELGFSTFFLNRTNRSGIITGGVIGGKFQGGKWKLDARFNKQDLIARIERIARYAHRIRLYNVDAAVFIRQVIPSLPLRTLVYLDPPYYGKGQQLYENHYRPPDHEAIAKLTCLEIPQPWIVSYDAAPEIVDLYRGYESISYSISYSAQRRYQGEEIMFFSPTLCIPQVANPTRP